MALRARCESKRWRPCESFAFSVREHAERPTSASWFHTASAFLWQVVKSDEYVYKEWHVPRGQLISVNVYSKIAR